MYLEFWHWTTHHANGCFRHRLYDTQSMVAVEKKSRVIRSMCLYKMDASIMRCILGWWLSQSVIFAKLYVISLAIMVFVVVLENDDRALKLGCLNVQKY